nr:efflux RND transporter periplasmic adaptor subunit [Neolewinella aurantiaca]
MNKLLIALSVMTFLFLFGCESEHHTESHHNATPTLAVTTPLIRDTTVLKEYVAQIHASRHIELRALERGYLQHIYVDEGETVRRGQVMFGILPNIYEAELQLSEAEADIVSIELKNTRMLAEKNVVSPNELALAEAKLAKAKAEVSLAQTHLDFTKISAPYTGIIDHLHVREGSLVEEGELLTTLSDNSKMWVYFNVPEAEYLDYAANKSSRQTDVELKLANGRIFDHHGIVSTIEGEFDHQTGNIEFRATFPNPDRLLRHGETGNIEMALPFKDAMLIPQKATFEILDKKYVYVVNDKNELEQRKIGIAGELPHLYIINEGLAPEDNILIEGLRRVKNGQQIKVRREAPKAVLAQLDLHAE